MSTSRKITIPINLGSFGWLFMVAGLGLALLAAADVSTRYGFAGVCLALIGKQLLNRGMLAHIEQEIEDMVVREVEAFELGRRTGTNGPRSIR